MEDPRLKKALAFGAVSLVAIVIALVAGLAATPDQAWLYVISIAAVIVTVVTAAKAADYAAALEMDAKGNR